MRGGIPPRLLSYIAARALAWPTADWGGGNLSEYGPHSFIVKVWLEETAEEAGRAVWRGHVTHVPSGERRYVRRVDDIAAFILPYLESMGVQFCVRGRASRWLRRWKRCLTGLG